MTLAQRTVAVFVLGLSVLCSGPLSAQQSMVFKTLDVPGASQTWIYGINQSGEIVGTYTDGSGTHGFTYRGGWFSNIAHPSAPNATVARAIDDAGEVVGSFNNGNNQGFLLSGGVFTTITPPGVFNADVLFGITNNSVYGQMIVGSAGLSSFLDNLGTFSTINDPASTFTFANGINAAGKIVGEVDDVNGEHGFVDFQGTFTTFDVPNSIGTTAYGMNTLGTIVGGFRDNNGGHPHGFVDFPGVTPQFTTIDYPGIAAGAETTVYGTNGFGVLVGAYRQQVLGPYHGFVASWPRNPRPFINQPLVPDSAAPGLRRIGLFLTINGTGFVNGSSVYWNGGTYLTTTYVSPSQLTAYIPPAYLMKTGTATITVTNPSLSGGGGGVSNPQYFVVSSSHTVSLTRSDIVAGRQPERVATADFNGDGLLDIVAADPPNNELLLFLGNGNGTFQAPLYIGTGLSPANVIAGDFNGDGRQDLATVNSIGNSVSIIFGNGNGTFQPHIDSGVAVGNSNTPVWLAAGDFDHDGNLDLAVLNSNGSVSILISNGDGTFHPPTNFATTGSGPSSLATGDFNRDGNLDLVVTNFNNFGGNSVSIFLGNGDGTFRYYYDPTVAAGPLGVAVADLNRDGILDLAVVAGCGDSSSCGRPGSVSILIGNGDGTFQPKVDYNAGSFPYSIVAADFRSSGVLDLAVTDLDSGSLTFLWGQGNGTFPSSTLVTTNARPVGLVAGDFNGDGKLDLAIGGDNPAGVTVMLQQ